MHIFAKKSLGQNFLKSQGALRLIAEKSGATKDDTVLEIGPGKGALTEKLLEKQCRVIAVEKDDRLIGHLAETFGPAIAEKKLRIVHGDILDLDLEDLGLPADYILAANLPYYITGAALRLFLSGAHPPKRAVLLLQKEVAKRIAAADGKESLLSISVKVFGKPNYVETVKAKYFSPMPKVDSAILAIENISRKNFAGIDEEFFFSVVKAGFAHKRKQLAGNLEAFADAQTIKDYLTECGAEKQARAEELRLGQWLDLAKKLHAKA